ncbi:MAG: DUF58 domain-containing protein [Planctomycetia bacterium]|nr:DUF58 domain-containing protein [Planctomycetia bacterium]
MATPASWPDHETLELLRHLAIREPRTVPASLTAGRWSREMGMSLDIADFRAYAQGDDPRHLDWTQLAKFDQLVIRLFYAQRTARMAIVLDGSASMDFGRPHKFDFARLLAACLSLIALNGSNEVQLLPTGDTATDYYRRSASTSIGVAGAEILRHLRSLRPLGVANWPALARRITRWRDTLLIVISDGLPPGDNNSMLRAFAGRGARLVVLHTLSPQELQPQFTGSPTLREPESGRLRRIAEAVTAWPHYQDHLSRWRTELRNNVQRSNGIYIDICTSETMTSVLTGQLQHILDRNWPQSNPRRNH